MLRSIAFGIVGSVVLFSCSDPAMEKRVVDLEDKIAQLEEKVAARPAAPAGAPNQPDPKETEAAELLRSASELAEKGEYQEAKDKLEQLKAEFGATRAARAGERLRADLQVIGTEAPSLATEHWFQGNTGFADGTATLVIFWEVWCPHCKREVPKLQATYEKYNPQGLNVLGLTKQSRDTTDDAVTEFISSTGIGYPIAREEGESMSNAFNVRGVPSAAVIKQGKVVWKGHPARITDDMIEGWIGS